MMRRMARTIRDEQMCCEIDALKAGSLGVVQHNTITAFRLFRTTASGSAPTWWASSRVDGQSVEVEDMRLLVVTTITKISLRIQPR